MDEVFPQVYTEAVAKASEVGTEPRMPRVAGRQKHKENNPADTPEDYFKRNVAIPFLDHILTNLDIKFDGKSLKWCTM